MTEPKTCVQHEVLANDILEVRTDINEVKKDCKARNRLYLTIAMGVLGTIASIVSYAVVTAHAATQSVEVHKAWDEAETSAIKNMLKDIKTDLRALREAIK